MREANYSSGGCASAPTPVVNRGTHVRDNIGNVEIELENLHKALAAHEERIDGVVAPVDQPSTTDPVVTGPPCPGSSFVADRVAQLVYTLRAITNRIQKLTARVEL